MDACERATEPLGVDRLEQIIDRICLERPDSIPIVGRHERDERDRRVLQEANDAEPIHFRHLEVEERKVRPLRFDHAHGSGPVRRLTDELHVGALAEERSEKGARRALVVGDDDAESLAHGTSAAVRREGGAGAIDCPSATAVTGNRTSTVVPAPTVLRRSSDASDP